LTISLNRLEICTTRPGPAEFSREAKSGGGVGVPSGALLGLIACVALLAGCGQAPEPEQKAGQQEAAVEGPSRNQADEKAWAEALRADSASALTGYLQAFSSGQHVAEARERLAGLEEKSRKDADDAAWADATRAGNASAFSTYLENFSSGAHAAEARRRLAALDQQARKEKEKEQDDRAWSDALHSGTATAIDAYVQNFGAGAHVAEARQRLAALEEERRKASALDDKAWTDAVRAGTAPALAAYIQNFGFGTHIAEARQRLAAIEEGERSKAAAALRINAAAIPIVDIRKTCRAAAAVTVTPTSRTAGQSDVDVCLDSEQRAREQIAKDLATFSSADRTRCIQKNVYLPSYIEWLTCLEMERDVRKMNIGRPDPKGAVTLPKVAPGPLR